LQDAPIIARFNLRLAAETEGLHLDPERVAAGVSALLGDPAKGVYYVAEAASQVVGQLMITFEWSDWRNGNIWWLQSVFVDPVFRRRGVFRLLFKHVQHLAQAQEGVRALRLYMHSENDRARRTYERLGMQRTAYEVFEQEFLQHHA
jgi:GNAT superfamily N-acetyltransferase